MKTVLKAAATAGVSFFTFLSAQCDVTVTIEDRNMTVEGYGSFSSALTAEQLSAIKDNTVTNITVRNAGGKSSQSAYRLLLDVALDGYRGAWYLLGEAAVTAEGALGDADTADAPAGKITIDKENDGSLGADIDFSVDRPVVIVGTNSQWEPLYSMKIALTFSRKVSAESSFRLLITGNTAKMYFDGGLEAPGTVRTRGANGHITIRNVPCKVGTFYLNYTYLNLNVAGNEVGKFTSEPYHSQLHLNVEDAISGCASEIVELGINNSAFVVDLHGHDAVFGKVGKITGQAVFQSTSPAKLEFVCDSDFQLCGDLRGAVTLKKSGTGTMTIDRSISSTGGIEVSGGRVELGSDAVWLTCQTVTLSGGVLSVANGDVFLAGVGFDVKDASASGVLEIADGCLVRSGSLTVGGSPLDGGYYCGAEIEGAELASFMDPEKTGMLLLVNALDLDLEEGTEKTLREALGETQFDDLNGGKYTHVVKKGTGTLILDEELDCVCVWELKEGLVKVTAHTNAFGRCSSFGNESIFIAHACTPYFGVTGQKTVIEHRITAEGGSNTYKWRFYGEVRFGGFIEITKYALSLFLPSGSKFYPDGGLKTALGVVNEAANCHIGFGSKGNPFEIGGTFNPIWVTVDIKAPSNRIEKLWLRDSVTLKIFCDDVFAQPYPEFVMRPEVTGVPKLDLNGKTLEVGNLTLVGEISKTSANLKGTSILTSNKPGTLSFVQTTAKTNKTVNVRGLVSFVKGGPAPFTFDKDIEATGTLTVTGGTFALSAQASWLNCTNVTVSGAGSAVEINKSETFSKKADIELSDGGRIVLPTAGTVQRAAGLFIDGVMKNGGTWGSSESPAKNKDDEHFSGPGVVRFTRNIGMTVIVK